MSFLLTIHAKQLLPADSFLFLHLDHFLDQVLRLLADKWKWTELQFLVDSLLQFHKSFAPCPRILSIDHLIQDDA